MQTTYYCDGSGWSGRESGYVVLPVGKKPIIEFANIEFTNNEMEYIAVIEAAELAEAGDIIRTDSRLVCGQLNLGWRIKAPHLLPLYKLARNLMVKKGLTIEWVSRDANPAGKIIDRLL